MKRKILPLILILLLGFGGCSKGFNFTIGSIESNTKHKMSGSYYKFNGSKTTHLAVDEGESIDVNVDITTKDGSLDASIYNEDLEYSYEGQDIITSTFTVTLSEPGNYTIKVVGDMHKGSYSFSWK